MIIAHRRITRDVNTTPCVPLTGPIVEKGTLRRAGHARVDATVVGSLGWSWYVMSSQSWSWSLLVIDRTSQETATGLPSGKPDSDRWPDLLGPLQVGQNGERVAQNILRRDICGALGLQPSNLSPRGEKTQRFFYQRKISAPPLRQPRSIAGGSSTFLQVLHLRKPEDQLDVHLARMWLMKQSSGDDSTAALCNALACGDLASAAAVFAAADPSVADLVSQLDSQSQRYVSDWQKIGDCISC